MCKIETNQKQFIDKYVKIEKRGDKMDDFIRPQKKVEKKKKNHKSIKEIFIIMGIIICLGLGYVAGYMSKKTTVVEKESTQKNIVLEAYESLSQYWVNSGDDIDFDEAVLKGMVAGLGDPYSSVLTSQEAVDFNQSVSGIYQGIGISYSPVEKGILVTKVYDNSPAQKGGLKAADIIVKVDQTNLEGLSDDKIKECIKGDEGTEVSLSILRNNQTMHFQIKRESLDLSTFYEIRKNNKNSFGYIELSTFGVDTAKQVEEALQYFQDKKIDTLVLDLRDNGGGYLLAAQDILDLFFTSDEVIYQQQEKNDSPKKYKAESDSCYQFKNNYILINENTASASELTAGALQSEKGFQLIGEKSYGKGTVQTQKVLSDGTVLKYTYAKWLLPNGKSIHGKGLTPDVEVSGISLDGISTGEVDQVYQMDCVSSYVSSMQKMLKALGYQVDREDGYFSKGSCEALKAFEKDYYLTINGEYDENDKKMLMAQLLVRIRNHENDQQYQRLMEIIG